MSNKNISQKEKKEIMYAVQINQKLLELFSEDSDINIDPKELKDDENLICFIHALANLVPNRMYNQLTGDKKDMLEFNHLANYLCFEYGKIED